MQGALERGELRRLLADAAAAEAAAVAKDDSSKVTLLYNSSVNQSVNQMNLLPNVLKINQEDKLRMQYTDYLHQQLVRYYTNVLYICPVFP